MTIAKADALPSGPFKFTHRSLQTGLRAWVEAQTGHPLGYVEQLYTFADSGRTGDASSPHTISISYLGLTREDQVGARFRGPLVRLVRLFPLGRPPRRHPRC